jgi:hypothetical protein
MSGTEDLVKGMCSVLEHEDQYNEAENYYEGNEGEFFADPKIRDQLRKSSSVYRVNFAKTPVNTIADRLEIHSLLVPNDDEMTERLLEEVWKANQLDLWMLDIFQKCGMYGDGYFIVWPRTDAELRITGVKATFVPPEQMRVFYDPEDNLRIEYAVRWWKAKGGRLRADVFYTDRIEKYVTNGDGKNGKEISDWDRFEKEGEEWPLSNPYGMCVFHMRNTFPYGRPDHLDAYGPQNALNKLTGTQMDTVDTQGAPQRFVLLDGDPADAQVGPQGALPAQFNDERQVNTAGTKTNTAGLKGGPGSAAMIPKAKAAGQWNAADPKVFLEPSLFWIRSMAQVTNTPMYRMDPTGDRPSGESLRVEDAPVTKMVQHRQRLYGATLRDMLEFALFVLTEQKVNVVLAWKPAGLYDDKTTWEVAKAKQDAGVPVDVTLLQAGEDPGQVKEWMADTMLDRSLGRAALIATLSKEFGQAAALQVLTREQVQNIIQSYVLLNEEEDDEDEDESGEDNPE